MFDRQYCSAAHRALGRVRSARAIRDSGDFDLDADWTVTISPTREPKNSAARASAAIAGLACIVTLVVLWVMPPSRETAAPAPADYSLPGAPAVRNFQKRWLPTQPSIRLREDFQAGFRGWVADAATGQEWSVRQGILRPGKLRLWTASLNLADYDFEFEGQIEQKAMSWAFRAADHANYYATKVVIASPGPMPRAEIARYTTRDGRAGKPVYLPLPITVRPDSVYQVKVRVKGNLFTTSINGQIVDTWSDDQFKRGGVGFFSEKGEAADIRWASVSTIEPGLFERLFASTFLLTPSLLPSR